MKASVFEKYGGPEVVRLQDINKPTPGDNDILIKVKATTVTAVDSIFRNGKTLSARMATGILRPKIPVLGTELSGVVEEVGGKVSAFAPGDAVFAETGTNYGAHAEYVCISQDNPVVHKPDGISFRDAAAIPYGSLTALSFLRDCGHVKLGQKVLVLGASGSVGSYAVQLARYLGAEVTGVCSTGNVNLVRSLGADLVIDYKKEDVTTQANHYDVIFDAVGKYSFSLCKKMLTKEGIYMTTVIGPSILWQMMATSLAGGRKAKLALTGLRSSDERKADLQFIIDLVENNKLRPVIDDRTFQLDQIIEAHRYVDTGRKKGNVSISMDKGNNYA